MLHFSVLKPIPFRMERFVAFRLLAAPHAVTQDSFYSACIGTAFSCIQLCTKTPIDTRVSICV